jgi:hypothetical protein
MKTYTFDENTYSDLYKDVYGFRPRNDGFFNSSDDEKQDIWDYLLEELDRVIAMEEKREQAAIVEFEKLVQETMAMGAKTRKTAIRWLADSFDKYDDFGYMCFEYGIPYSYEKEFEKAVGIF